ncbi:MAG: hypothetical protein WC716_16525 [Chitinophagaceae bacterium]|jgi:hypothetical protein
MSARQKGGEMSGLTVINTAKEKDRESMKKLGIKSRKAFKKHQKKLRKLLSGKLGTQEAI